MTDEAALRLEVDDIFRFSDGTTIFVGRLNGVAKLITQTVARLWIDDQPGPYIRIDGERMPSSATPHLRSVSTRENVEKLDVRAHRYTLVWEKETTPPAHA